MIQTYQKYSSLGLSCLPTQESKMPVAGLKTWKGGVDEELYYEDCFGIAVICGSDSGGLECIDFDNHFGDAKEVISEFINIPEINELYLKYKFPIESTVGGGYHLLYKCDKISGNQKLARRPKFENNKWRPDAIIETRGDGGYFVAAPTPGYKFVKNSIDNIPIISETERDIILSSCKSFNTWVDKEHTHIDEQKDKPGDIYNEKSEAITDSMNCLRSAGWVEVSNGKWRRPGKKEGISATFGKVANNVFYNFSSSGYPFEPESAYKPFQIVSLLKHNGDFSAFAKELAEKYTDITTEKKPEKKKGHEPLDNHSLDDILNKAYIDIDIPIAKPPIVMYIYERIGVGVYSDRQRLLTLGNFSAITGKGKSKKTFLCSILLAAASANGSIQDKFYGSLPDNKRGVLLFDTEQSGYDAWIASKRIKDIANQDIGNFGAFDLRQYTPLQRCDIIEHGIKKYSDNLGFVVIDGIADLAKAINDEEEATRVGSLLMRWTKEHNIHIVTVIHQNKGDNYATGHLGSMIIKKAEAVISVEKDSFDRNRSIVSCDNIRGTMDFEDFVFDIVNHIPVVDHKYNPSKKNIEL